MIIIVQSPLQCFLIVFSLLSSDLFLSVETPYYYHKRVYVLHCKSFREKKCNGFKSNNQHSKSRKKMCCLWRSHRNGRQRNGAATDNKKHYDWYDRWWICLFRLDSIMIFQYLRFLLDFWTVPSVLFFFFIILYCAKAYLTFFKLVSLWPI